MMRKNAILVAILILTVLAVMDFTYNGSGVFVDFFDQMVYADRHRQPQQDLATARASRVDSIRESFPVSALNIDNRYGTVTVLPAGDDVLDIEGNVTVYADTETLASQFLEEVSVKAEVRGSEVFVQLETPQSAPAGVIKVGVDYTVLAPAGWKLSVSNSFGMTSVERFNNEVNVKTSFGPTTIKNIAGPVRADSRHGSLKVTGVNGDVQAFNQFDAIDLMQVTGSVNVYSRHGRVSISEVTGPVKVSNAFDDVEIRNVEGAITANCEHGNVYVSGAPEAIAVDNRFGDISVYDLQKGAQLETRHGSVKVRLASNASFLVDARSKNGRVRSSYPLEIEEERTDYQAKGIIGGGEHRLYLRTEFGSIDID